MLGMFMSQANRIAILLLLVVGLAACASPQVTLVTPTPVTIPSPTFSPTPLPPIPTATTTPLTCLSQPGEMRMGEVPTSGAPTSFYIYLPPCYEYFTDQRYPVLYLLNGIQLDKDTSPAGDQWLRIGAPAALDALIISGQVEPFIIVFPDDRYWNVVQGQYFGQFLVNDIIPFIDQNFRTIADRPHRAVGGLSRGGGWAFNIMFTHPDVFGSVGLHSPAVRVDDRSAVVYFIRQMPPELWPRIYFDTGDNDSQRGYNTMIEGLLALYSVPHEWHLNNGAHTLEYWTAHVTEYLLWYAEGFATAGPPLPTSTPQPTVVPDSTLPATATAPAESSATTTP